MPIRSLVKNQCSLQRLLPTNLRSQQRQRRKSQWSQPNLLLINQLNPPSLLLIPQSKLNGKLFSDGVMRCITPFFFARL